MATGGPYIDPRATPSVDEALAPIVEQATTSTTGAPPPIPQDPNPLNPQRQQRAGGGGLGPLQVDVQDTEWAWRPTQQDFGQVDVRRGQYDTGQVPTVNVQMPFAALANRQQALANRKAALDQKVAAFDPYAGLGKAADPYNRNFGKIARAGMDQLVQEIADARFGGDTKAAYRGIVTDPELGSIYKSRAAEFNEVGAMSNTLVDDAIKNMTAYEAMEEDFSPEGLQAMREMINGVGQFGGPQGPDVTKLVDTGRRYESVLSREKAYKDWVVNSGLKQAMQTLQAEGRIDRTKGGLIRLTETEETNFNALKQKTAEDWAAKGIGGSYEDNMKWLDARLPTSVVTETELRNPPNASGGSGPKLAANSPAAYNVTYTPLPQSIFNRKDKEGNVIERPDAPGSEKEFPSITLYNMSSDQATFPRAYDFRTDAGTVTYDAQGNKVSETSKPSRVTAHPTDVVNLNGKLFIVARKTTQPRASAVSKKQGGDPFSSLGDEGEGDNIQDFNQLEVVMIPYKGNEAIVEAGFGYTEQGLKDALLSRKARLREGAEPIGGGGASQGANSWY